MAGLNDQSRWSHESTNIGFRRSLWWNLYFLDKRVTQKGGIAYFIRESEVAVDDFSKHDDGPHREVDAEHQDFIQTEILYSRLWTRTWDTFFAPKAPNANNWEEILIMDARVMIAERQSAPRMRWNPDQVEELVRNGEDEWRIRRRLLSHTRFLELRLTIRQGTLPDKEIDTQRRRSCFHIAKEIVDGVEKYMSIFSGNRAAEYMLTSTLVKSIYYIVPESRDDNTPLDKEVIRNTLCTASRLLKSMVPNVAAASRAFQALRCVLLLDEEVGGASKVKAAEDGAVTKDTISETDNTQLEVVNSLVGGASRSPFELWSQPQFSWLPGSNLVGATPQILDSNTYIMDESQALSDSFPSSAMAYSFDVQAGNLSFGTMPPTNPLNGSFFNLDVGWEVNEFQGNQMASNSNFDWDNIQFNV